MTNLEAIGASVIYPVEEAKLNKALFDRDLTPTDQYTKENKKALDLACADLYGIMVTAPQISEGGFSLSLSDKSNLLKVASSIYVKYGESDPFAAKSTITGVSPW